MYVRRKASPSKNDYCQLVESRRVDGKPRQRVVVHLGRFPTVEEAVNRWPREIDRLRRLGDAKAADELRAKLDLLRKLCSEGVV